MAKLKFDRQININLKDEEKIKVPTDEIWKGTILCRRGSHINGKDVLASSVVGQYAISDGTYLTGGTTMDGLMFNGLVFKVVQS